MTKVNEIGLLSETATTDSIGQPVITTTEVKLIAEIRSISQSEFMNARQNGITPSYTFRISAFGYSGQKLVKYDGNIYSVYRTYEPDDNYIELYTEVRAGVTYE